jgi:hypothetical protein
MHTVPCYKKKVLTMVGQQIERSLYKKKVLMVGQQIERELRV